MVAGRAESTGSRSKYCPLCQSAQTLAYHADKRRQFLQCQACALVFADPNSWPNPQQEKTEYDLHDNVEGDPGYERFLSRMANALGERLNPASSVLDFGCGPAPVLARQLETQGHRVRGYDVFYQPDTSALDETYDAIVLTEVLEHLHSPMTELTRLWSKLTEHGLLAIMTQRVISQARFGNWQYKNDPTHVCFYSEQTFSWLANALEADSIEYADRDLVFLHR